MQSSAGKQGPGSAGAPRLAPVPYSPPPPHNWYNYTSPDMKLLSEAMHWASARLSACCDGATAMAAALCSVDMPMVKRAEDEPLRCVQYAFTSCHCQYLRCTLRLAWPV